MAPAEEAAAAATTDKADSAAATAAADVPPPLEKPPGNLEALPTETKAPEETGDAAAATTEGAEAAASSPQGDKRWKRRLRTAEGDGQAATEEAAKEGEAAPAEEKAPEPVYDEATYGLHVDPEGSFTAARQVVAQLHDTLLALKLTKAADAEAPPVAVDAEAEEGAAAAAAPQPTPTDGRAAELARQLTLQLLSLRRAHRGMAKAVEAGRSAEAAARRTADNEFSHMESRQHDNARWRAAAGRCRTLCKPNLDKVLPLLQDLGDAADDDKEEAEVAALEPDGATSLTRHLEMELQERTKLAEELDALEKKRDIQLEAFRARKRLSDGLASKLKAAESALAAVSEYMGETPPSAGADVAAVPAGFAQLAAPLQTVFTKFNVLRSGGPKNGVASLQIVQSPVRKSEEEPDAKKARSESVVEVGISASATEKQDSVACRLRFACEPGSADTLVTVSCTGARDGEKLLAGLWSEDNALAQTAESLSTKGKLFGWAQVLGGAKDSARTLVAEGGAGPLVDGSGVTADDVVERVRAALA